MGNLASYTDRDDQIPGVELLDLVKFQALRRSIWPEACLSGPFARIQPQNLMHGPHCAVYFPSRVMFLQV